MPSDDLDPSRRPLLVIGALGLLVGLVLIALNVLNPPVDRGSMVVSGVIIAAGLAVLLAASRRGD